MRHRWPVPLLVALCLVLSCPPGRALSVWSPLAAGAPAHARIQAAAARHAPLWTVARHRPRRSHRARAAQVRAAGRSRIARPAVVPPAAELGAGASGALPVTSRGPPLPCPGFASL